MMVEKVKHGKRVRGCSWLASLLIVAGLSFLAVNYFRLRPASEPGNLGQYLGETVGQLGEEIGQAAGEIGRDIGDAAGAAGQGVGEAVGDLGRSIGELFTPPGPSGPDLSALWPLLLISAGLFLIFRRSIRGKSKNMDWVSEDL